MGVGQGKALGGGIREWNVEFILLGAQLFILISPVSCCIFLILGLNPDSTSFSVAGLGKADTGYNPAPCSHHLSYPAAKRGKKRAGPSKKYLPTLRTTLCPSTGNEVFKVSHLTSKTHPQPP